MGGESTILAADGNEARHLLRRTTLGGFNNETFSDTVTRWTDGSTTRGDAANELLNFAPSHFKPRGRYIEDVHNSWMKYMVRIRLGLQEKLVLFWHDHFATAYTKVQDPKKMGQQNQLLRSFCRGNFKDFVKAINKNAAMIEFLDTVRNFQDQPNENYGRELQELFTLGVKDLAGNNNYTQSDVSQIARAFSGWSYNDRNLQATFNDGDHDYNSDWQGIRGPKVIYKTTGHFPALDGVGRDFARSPDGKHGATMDPISEGEPEIDTVVNIIFAHTDTDGKNTVARYIAKKLITYFANSTPSTAFIDAVVNSSSFDTAWDIGNLVYRILVHDDFYATAAGPPYLSTSKKSVKWPIDYVVSTLRLLDMKLKSRDQYVNGGEYARVRDRLTDMGQTLLDPPSVFGWNWENAWINSATTLARCSFARDVIAARGNGRTCFHPEGLIDTTLTNAGLIVDAVTDVLGMTDQLDSDAKDALVSYLIEPATDPMTPVTLTDSVVDKKLRGLFGLVLQSPHFQLQ